MSTDLLGELRLKDLGLSLWTRFWLKWAGITTPRDLISRTSNELLRTTGIGEDGLAQIWHELGRRGLRLGMGRTM